MQRYNFDFASVVVECVINTIVMIFMLEYYNYRQRGGKKGSTYEHVFVNFLFNLFIMFGAYYFFHRFTMFGHVYTAPIYAKAE